MTTMLILLFLYSMICIHVIHGYPPQKCYICQSSSCIHPAKSDVKDCSDSTDDKNQDTSGKNFVNGALGGKNPANIYDTVAQEFAQYSHVNLGLDNSSTPSWNSLTRWVCYVSIDKRRGCLVMAKGHCSEDKSWLGKINDLGGKISNIMKKAKDAVDQMFKDVSVTTSLNKEQKSNISNWFAEKYMSKLVNHSTDPQFQLDSCCEGSECNNFASMIHISTAVLSLLSLSSFILI